MFLYLVTLISDISATVFDNIVQETCWEYQRYLSFRSLYASYQKRIQICWSMYNFIFHWCVSKHTPGSVRTANSEMKWYVLKPNTNDFHKKDRGGGGERWPGRSGGDRFTFSLQHAVDWWWCAPLYACLPEIYLAYTIPWWYHICYIG